MSATVQTIKKFSEETGMSVTKIRELIRQKIIPEVPREHSDCMQLINKKEFDRRLEGNLIEIPIPERSKKKNSK